MSNSLTCPVCNGSKLVALSEEECNKYWNKGKTHRQCQNCGGQYMFGQATGLVAARPDGAACEHDYDYKPGRWRCTHDYTCKHCGDQYTIDSSD